MSKTSKRILKVVVKRMLDTDPDTSYLGKYSNRPESEYVIDRAHSEDCIENDVVARQKLERIASHVDDMYNEVVSDENDTTWEYLQDARDTLESLLECDCGKRGGMGRNEYRYFNGPVENYKGDTPENIRKYVRQDYERMESLNRGDWWYIGIRAEVEIRYPYMTEGRGGRTYFKTDIISSGGLWRIESDSGEDYLQSIAKEELADLRGQLKALGFSSRAISTAFKNVEEVND